MASFTWGTVIDVFDYDFDGKVMQVTKYHPWKRSDSSVLIGQPDTEVVEYHCEELHESAASLDYLLLAWLANKNLGSNQHTLVAGLSRALGITKDL
jgi:hypothetical protein